MAAEKDTKCPICRITMRGIQYRVWATRLTHNTVEVWAMIWLGFLALGPGVAFGLRYNHGVQLVASSLAYMATGFMMCVLSSIAMAGMAREIMAQIDPQLRIPDAPVAARFAAALIIPPLALAQAGYLG